MEYFIGALINKKTVTYNIEVIELALVEDLPIHWLRIQDVAFIQMVRLSKLAKYPVLFFRGEDGSIQQYIPKLPKQNILDKIKSYLT